MIAFDNGPAHGDYVRYIDDLMKRGAIAEATAALPSTETAIGGVAQTRERLAALAAGRTPYQGATGWQQPGDAQDTGFSTPSTPSARATAAAAIASALASGQMSGSSFAIRTQIGLVAIAFGIALIAAGFFWTPLNILFIAGGGVLIAWAIRMMRNETARGSSTRR